MLFGLIYEFLFVAYRGATLGKMALGIKVVDQRTGGLIGQRRALVRQLIPFAGALVCFVGALLVYASPLFDRSGRIQGWHDKAAHDLVVKMRNRKERSAQPEGILMRNNLDDVSDAAGDAQRAAPLASAPWWLQALTNMGTAALIALVFGGYGARPTLWTALAFLACAIVVVVAPREVRRRGGHPPRSPAEFPRASLAVLFVTFVALFVAAILLRGFLTPGTAQAYGAAVPQRRNRARCRPGGPRIP